MSKLIYDLGMHDGADTAFYLHKGYRVLAIEANPTLCERARTKFADAIADGRLTILDLAVSDTDGEATFYINLDDDHWSSLDPAWGTRNDTRYKTTAVQTRPLCWLIEQYGVPHYLKIDIEGADLTVLRQLQAVPVKPTFLSTEEHEIEYFPLLWSLGYRGFKIVNQGQIHHLDYDGWHFEPGSSGPFGDEIPGPWLPFGEAMLEYMLNVRDCRERELFTFGWWYDIHATLSQPALPADHPYPVRRISTRSRLRSAASRIKKALTR